MTQFDEHIMETGRIPSAASFNRGALVEDSNALRNQQTVLASGGLPFVQFEEQEVGCWDLAAVTSAAIHETA